MKAKTRSRIVRQGHIVANAQLVEQETRLRGIWFEFAAQMANKGTQVGILAAIVGPPDALEQILVGQHLARVAGQFAEQIVLGRGEMDLLAAGPHQAMGVVYHQARLASAAVEGALDLDGSQPAAQTGRLGAEGSLCVSRLCINALYSRE